MRSSENTFLSKQGFADPDKKTSRHDMACAFLARPDIQEKLLAKVFPKRAESKIKASWLWAEFPRGTTYAQRDLCVETKANVAAVILEHLVLGTRQGALCFIDVVLKGHLNYSCVINFPKLTHGWSYKSWVELLENNGIKFDLVGETENTESVKIRDVSVPIVLGVEIKTLNNPIGEGFKQLKYYKTVMEADAWMLVTDYDIFEVEKETLARENIEHAVLRLDFDTYVREQLCKLNIPTITL